MPSRTMLFLCIYSFISFSVSRVAHAVSEDYVSKVACTQILKDYYWRPNVKKYYYWDANQIDVRSADEYIVEKLGNVNPVSAHDAIVCECKLRPSQTIGSAVSRVIAEGKQGRWYVNPPGGTQTPKEAKFREKMEKWFAGDGPRPSIDGEKACEISNIN